LDVDDLLAPVPGNQGISQRTWQPQVWRNRGTSAQAPALAGCGHESRLFGGHPGEPVGSIEGDRAGQHSIRINDRWRICFSWREASAHDVEIVDYHRGRGRIMAQRRKLPPIHPGELLRDELNEIGVSLNELGRALRVPMNRISAIVNGKRAVTVDTAMRLARFFGTSPQYWLNLQNAYDLEVSAQELVSRIEREVLPRTAA
jgi:addiction module HigA family antidote